MSLEYPCERDDLSLKIEPQVTESGGNGIQDAGCRIQDSGFRIQDTGYRIQDAGCKIQDRAAALSGFPLFYPESCIRYLGS